MKWFHKLHSLHNISFRIFFNPIVLTIYIPLIWLRTRRFLILQGTHLQKLFFVFRQLFLLQVPTQEPTRLLEFLLPSYHLNLEYPTKPREGWHPQVVFYWSRPDFFYFCGVSRLSFPRHHQNQNILNITRYINFNYPSLDLNISGYFDNW